jgi:hypothetical protein
MQEIQSQLETKVKPHLPTTVSFDGYDFFGAKNDIEVRKCHFDNKELHSEFVSFHQRFGIQDGDVPKPQEPNFHVSLRNDKEGVIKKMDTVQVSTVFIKQLGPFDPCFTITAPQ